MNRNAILMSEYEQRLRQNPHDIETRWNLILTRYEAVYSGDEILLGRMDQKTIYEDQDARIMLNELDGEAKTQFLRQIKQLAECQEAVLKATDTDPRYDVYLAFDPSCALDASIAEEIYRSLETEGISVYYEPVLKLSGLRDGHRLLALQNAKVLLLVGTSKEHMQVTETKGAWMRYLNMMERDTSKHLLPAYRGMRPEDFPQNLSKIQGIDLGRIGSIQAILVPRIKELIHNEPQIIVIRKQDGKKVNVSNILNRISFFITDAQFKEAENRLNAFADEYGKDYEQYHYLNLFLQYKASDIKELSLHADAAILQNPSYLYVMEHGTVKHREEFGNILKNKEEHLRKEKEEVLLEKIHTAHINNEYERVLQLTEEIKSIPGFSRWKEIQEFYQAAKTRKDHQAMLNEYKDLVGDGEKFYLNQLKKKDEQKYNVVTAYDPSGKKDFSQLPIIITAVICFLSIFICRNLPDHGKDDFLQKIFILCWIVTVYTIYKNKGSLLWALISGSFFSIGIPFGIVAILEITRVMKGPESPLAFIPQVFAKIVDMELKVDKYGYSTGSIADCLVYDIRIFYFIFRGIAATGKYRSKNEKYSKTKKQYQKLMSSGFLEKFQKEEYEELERKYKNLVGEQWVEPKKMW